MSGGYGSGVAAGVGGAGCWGGRVPSYRVRRSRSRRVSRASSSPDRTCSAPRAPGPVGGGGSRRQPFALQIAVPRPYLGGVVPVVFSECRQEGRTAAPPLTVAHEFAVGAGNNRAE